MGDIVDMMFQYGMLDYPDPFEHEEERQYKPIYCRYCGSSAVTWAKQEGKWRLFTNGQLHICNNYKKQK